MRMSVTVEESLIEQAQRLLGVTTKTEAIRVALEEVIRRAQLEKVLEHAGRVELEGGADELLKLRTES